MSYKNFKNSSKIIWSMDFIHLYLPKDTPQGSRKPWQFARRWVLSAKSLQLCPTLCNPMDCSPSGSSVHGDSPGKITGVGCHVLLQGIFPTQRSNLCLLHLLSYLISGRFFTTSATWKAQQDRHIVVLILACTVGEGKRQKNSLGNFEGDGWVRGEAECFF